MSALTPSSPRRHLRVRGEEGSQRTSTVELFFDLVYVFAITQLSHLILGELSVSGLAQAAFLLVVVWWAWMGAIGSGSAALLSQVRAMPQIRLEPKTGAVTAVVFRAETIAVIDHNQQIGEIAAPAARVDEVLADHDEVGRGSPGVTVNLTCARRVQTAVALIRESRDQELYGWQALAASP